MIQFQNRRTKHLVSFILILLASSLHAQDKVQNLLVFARAYGYVKYFHPSDEVEAIDWNKFSAFGVREISKSKNEEELIQTLNDIFYPIAPSVKFTSSKENYNFENITPQNAGDYMVRNWQHIGLAFGQHGHHIYQSIRICQPGYKGLKTRNTLGPLFEDYPSFGSLIEKEIGPSIYCVIPLTLYSSIIGTYPYCDKFIDFESELNQVSENLEDVNVRLGNIINVYNVFQHFYPYFDVVTVNWEAEFKTALVRSFSDQTAKDHLITLQKFTAPLRDGHIFILDGKEEWYTPPFNWDWIEDQLVITGVFNDSLDLKVGDRVTKVEGTSAEMYFEEIKSRISAGTKSYLNYIANTSSILGKKNSAISIEVNGRTIVINRSRNDFKKVEMEIMNNTYKLLDNDIFYINLTKIEMDTITRLLPQIQKAKSIICDARGYVQSKSQFLRHLLIEKDTSKSWFKVPRIIYPDQEKIAGHKTYSWELEPKAPYLGDKKIVFLINGKAVSASESFLSFVDHYDLGMLVGESTAGTNGAATSFSLLADIYIRWTATKVNKHDGSQHHAIGILPDFYVTKTINSLKAGKDDYLEKAIQLLQKE